MKTFLKKIWISRNEKFSLAVVGLLLTGVLSTFISTVYQNISWTKQQEFQVFKEEVNESKKAIETINIKIRDRIYTIQKIHWSLENYDLKSAHLHYKEYTKIKDKWNILLPIWRNKIKRLVNEELAFLLLDSNNSVNTATDNSVHAAFVRLHNATRNWKRCLERRKDGNEETKCKNIRFQELQIEADAKLQLAFETTDQYINDSYTIFLSKYKRLSIID